jgi:hypothetical protein
VAADFIGMFPSSGLAPATAATVGRASDLTRDVNGIGRRITFVPAVVSSTADGQRAR